MSEQNQAVIDLGSNTAILLIYQTIPKFKVVHEAFRIPRLAEGLLPGGELLPTAMERTANALLEFQALIHDHRAQLRLCGGTAPFRKARQAQQAIAKLEQQCGIRVQPLSEEEEAYASYLSAVKLPSLLAPQHSVDQACVMDIGGGSCELAWGKQSKMKGYHSLPIGCVDATEKYLAQQLEEQGIVSVNELSRVRKKLSALMPQLEIPKGGAFIAVAGTPVALGLLELGKTSYQPHWVDGLVVKRDRVEYWLEKMASVPLHEKVSRYGIVEGRAEVLLSGLIFLAETMLRYQFEEVVVRNAGLRYGLALQASMASAPVNH